MIKWVRDVSIFIMLSTVGYFLWHLSKTEEGFMWLFMIGAGLFYFCNVWEMKTTLDSTT